MKKLNLFLALFVPFSLFAQDNQPMLGRDQGIWQTITMLLIGIVFFYFILWRPEQKRRRVIEDLRSKLKQGDRVTAMGIVGTVLRVQDQTVILKMYDGSKVEFLKGAITDIAPEEQPEEKESEKKS